MISWDEKTLQSVLERITARVNFAGLVGTTAEMVKNGWVLNVVKEVDGLRDCMRLRIGGHNKRLNLHCVSGEVILDYEFFARRAHQMEAINYFSRIPWDVSISHVARNIIMESYSPRSIVSRDWSGYLDIKKPSKEMSISDFFGFPEASQSLFVPEKKIWTVQEHLDAIRGMQEPLQDEILRDYKFSKEEEKPLLKLVMI